MDSLSRPSLTNIRTLGLLTSKPYTKSGWKLSMWRSAPWMHSARTPHTTKKMARPKAVILFWPWNQKKKKILPQDYKNQNVIICSQMTKYQMTSILWHTGYNCRLQRDRSHPNVKLTGVGEAGSSWTLCKEGKSVWRCGLRQRGKSETRSLDPSSLKWN